MGIFGTLKRAIDIVTLGQSALVVKSIEVGGELVEITVDAANQVVRVGEDVFRAIPGELIFPGLGPLAGILKNEIEDELILLHPFGIIPSITIFIDGALVVGDLLGVIQHRTMRDDEFEVARHVFRDTLPPRDDIRLTNLAGFGGRAFTVPSGAGGAIVNMGKDYVHEGRIEDVPTLIHELTHVWQIARSPLPEVFLCSGLLAQIENEITDKAYDYTPGSQWTEYGLEQQAHIVQDWIDAAPVQLDTPLFRYVNANIRRANPDVSTSGARRLRTWCAEANVAALSLRAINPPAPVPWWA